MAAKQPWYRVVVRNGYLYIRFKTAPPSTIRTRMRAAGWYYSVTQHAWIVDDRFNTVTIARIIGDPLSDAPTQEVFKWTQ